MRAFCVLLLAAILFAAPTCAFAERRVALVIGIGDYDRSEKLANPTNDANDIAAALASLGFKVNLGLDTDQKALRQKIREFAADLQGADVALLFYAGHGLQVNGKNYLMPRDAQLASALDVELGEVTDLDTVLRQMTREARTTIVFLDACRDNPVAKSLGRSGGARSAQVGTGLAPVEFRPDQAGRGIYIAYATDPGEVASDGAARNSPFTAALLRHIATPGKSIHDMMLDVRREVLDATRSQRPRGDDGLVAPFYFKPRIEPATQTLPGGAGAVSASERAPEDDCDRLAAHPDDPAAVVRGIAFERIDAQRAIRSCELARSQHPKEKRFAYQLARALAAAGMREREKEIFEELAREGYAAALHNLGIMYETGKEVPQDVVAAVTHYRNAADRGHRGSMTAYAEALLNGVGAEKDEAGAVLWLRKAERAGAPRAKVLLGQMYQDGRGRVPKDETEAFRLYREAVEVDAAYACPLAQMYKDGKAVSKDLTQAAKWFERAAEGGCTTSMFALGRMHSEGTGVAKDDAMAMQWFRKAADRGQASSMLEIAEMHREGRGVPRNDSEAFAWVLKAAQTESAEAMHAVAYHYLKGIGTDKDPKQAADWYRRSADKGNTSAMYVLAELYLDGDGLEKDVETGLAWMRKAAETGDTDAMLALGDYYHLGRHVPKDGDEAARWYQRSIDGGNKRAIAVLGKMLLEGSGIKRSEDEGIRLLRRGVEAKIPQAMIYLGEAYQQGRGVPKNESRAFQWYSEAVELDATLGCPLARMYQQGKAVSKDLAEAMRWFEKAAAGGCTTSMNTLGQMYGEGAGVIKDDAKAAEWFRKAAERGDASSMLELARMYRDGRVGPTNQKDSVAALDWVRKAAEKGDSNAVAQLGEAHLAGDGVPKDVAKGMELLANAADRGDTYAMNLLASAHYEARDVPQNFSEALRRFRQSADNGNGWGMTWVGAMHELGRGVPKDEKLAAEWYGKAVEVGRDDARLFLARLHAEGRGVSKSEERARQLMRKAANSQNAEQVWNDAVWLINSSDFGLLRKPDQTATLLLLTFAAESARHREQLITDAEKFPAPLRMAIQTRLKSAGHYRGRINGQFGPDTKTALDAFALSQRTAPAGK